jgi:hypothetical protein
VRSPKFTKKIDDIAEGSSATDSVTDVTDVTDLTEVRKKKDAIAIISLTFSRSWGVGYFVF